MKLASALLISAMALPSLGMAATYFSEDFEAAKTSKDLADVSFTQFSVTSDKDWEINVYDDKTFAKANGYGGDAASDDWLISSVIDLSGATNPVLQFDTAKNYDGGDFKVKVSTDYTGSGSPATATWTEIAVTKLSKSGYTWVTSEPLSLSTYKGQAIYVAFQYLSTGGGAGEGAIWEVDNVKVEDQNLQIDVSATKSSVFLNTPTTLMPSVTGQSGSSLTYTLKINETSPVSWNGTDPISLIEKGKNTLVVTVNDGSGEATDTLELFGIEKTTQAILDKPADTIRVASYNINLIGESEVVADLPSLLENGNYAKAKKLAEVIQRVRPDIILLNEFDYDASGLALQRFKDNYLGVAQQLGLDIISYPHFYIAPVNTGVPSGMDLDKNNSTTDPGDAYGFGQYPGKYGMAVLSMYPIDKEKVRSFQSFLWKDMPNAMLPKNTDNTNWYSDEVLDIFRLSSKSHWDLPITVDERLIHILASHPTPPVFDGAEDRNGTRNHDEIRLWADYIDPAKSAYLNDDKGETGGLAADSRFVVMGDQNASPDEGDATGNAIQQLLDHSLVNSSMIPESKGGIENAPENEFSATHTANWKMRADYVLPSKYGIDVKQAAVFWPTSDNALYGLAEANTPTDHRLVYVDMELTGDKVSTDNPGNDNPGNDNPGNDNPGNDNPGNDNPGNDNPGNDNPGNDNPGNDNPDNDNPETDTPASDGGSRSSSGGCTVSPQASFDPMLLLMMLLSAGYLWQRRSQR